MSFMRTFLKSTFFYSLKLENKINFFNINLSIFLKNIVPHIAKNILGKEVTQAEQKIVCR
ncbi:hypothetical protein BpHYR1_022352 [Brachionus plicatilis]|uniref:Uncharacterized protein n=1 Tax=Brachionus plicatilis TaxID=10195 RepID=A0A3M7T374_BRAPC|nr:hypothetical protein BpHYR1_022352 [Brachionus plicatilis]